MKSILGKRLLSAWFVLLAAVCVLAQAPTTPHLGYAFPAGAQRGAVIQVRLGGQLLGSASAVYVTGQGVQATIQDYFKPLGNKEAQDIRQKLLEANKTLKLGPRGGAALPRLTNMPALQQLAKAAGVSDADLQAFLLFAANRLDPKRQPNPQLSEVVTLKVSVDPRATTGVHELRLLTPAGLSNPIRFVVGDLPEFNKTGAVEDVPDAVTTGLPVVINGQILPGGIDRYSFAAHRGAKLVISAAARQMIPYLADAVPGWFQIAVTLYDPKGKEVAFADHNEFRQDPAFYFKVPEDGNYTLEVRDAIYRGREDFVYRITIGELPFVATVFPLGGPAGSFEMVTPIGWNLPPGKVNVPAQQAPGIVPISIGGSKEETSAPFAVDTLREIVEKDSHGDLASAQMVALPIIVNGKIDRPGEADVFKFKGKAGDKIVAEVAARRLGSPLDSSLQLLDASGRQVAFNDDFDDKASGLITHQADSYLTATLPATGAYFVVVRDTQHKGGPAYSYRLRLSPPRPDYELRVVPASITARAGTTIPLTVYALRRDGFNGDIALQLKNAPPGFALGGAWVPAGADKMRVTLTVPGTPTVEPIKLELEGKSSVGNQEIRRSAVPCEDMMQAFAYRHLVPMDDWLLAIIGRANRGIGIASPASAARIPSGGTVDVHLDGPGRFVTEQMGMSLDDGPDGISIEKIAGDPKGVTLTLRADRAKAKAGTKGNLIVDLYIERTVTPPKGKAPVKRRFPVGTLPAIPFEVVR